MARIILTYLREQLPLHILDEERDLFQMLRARILAADIVDEAFEQLCHEHAGDQGVVRLVMAGLDRLARGRRPEDVDDFVRAAHAFAQAQRRHVAYENNSILPLARTRLTRKDLGRLGRRMAARRGLEDVKPARRQDL
jgi:hemerythrin-like domain-containing protein